MGTILQQGNGGGGLPMLLEQLLMSGAGGPLGLSQTGDVNARALVHLNMGTLYFLQ